MQFDLRRETSQLFDRNVFDSTSPNVFADLRGEPFELLLRAGEGFIPPALVFKLSENEGGNRILIGGS